MSRAVALVAVVSLALSLVACGSAPPPPAPAPCPCEGPAPAPPSANNCTEGFPYDLPREGEVTPPPPPLAGEPTPETPGVMTVAITPDGAMRVGDRRVDLDGLRRAATERHDREPEVRVIIHADRATPWGSVMQAIDGIKQGGIAKLAFGVAPNGG